MYTQYVGDNNIMSTCDWCCSMLWCCVCSMMAISFNAHTWTNMIRVWLSPFVFRGDSVYIWSPDLIARVCKPKTYIYIYVCVLCVGSSIWTLYADVDWSDCRRLMFLNTISFSLWVFEQVCLIGWLVRLNDGSIRWIGFINCVLRELNLLDVFAGVLLIVRWYYGH